MQIVINPRIETIMKKILLAVLAIATALTVSAQYTAPQIIATGGFHKHHSSGVKNSLSALKAAQKAKLYGWDKED